MGAPQTPWQAACTLHSALSAGSPPPPVHSPLVDLPREPEEYVVGVFSGLTYARFTAADVLVGRGGPTVVFGTPHFLAGYAAGSLAMRGRARRKARRMAQPQWRQRSMLRTVVTTHRLWCEIPGDEWKRFNYDTTVDVRLEDNALVMSFSDAPAVRIGGAWAPWLAVAAAHLTFGPTAAARLPWLARLAHPVSSR